MIRMPIVHFTFKIDVFKMEQVFKMGCREGESTFYVSFENWQGEEEPIS